MRKYIVLFFFFILFLQGVNAIGVTPARYDVDFSPGLSYDFEFFVLNNQDSPINADIGLRRDLVEYSSVSPASIVVPAKGRERFVVHMELPESLERPGAFYIEPVIGQRSAGGGISASAGVIPWIVVHVPYPGIYAEFSHLKLTDGIKGINPGETTPFSFGIINRGNQDLTGGKATITVRDQQTDETIVSEQVLFEPINPQSTSAKEIFLQTQNSSSGLYTITSDFYYKNTEGELLRISRNFTFRIGDFDVNIIEYSQKLIKGGIVPIYFQIENIWKGDINVDSTVSVGSLPPIQSPRILIPEFESRRINTFLDTSTLPLGNVSASVVFRLEPGNKESREAPAVSKEIPIIFTLIEEPEVISVDEETASISPAMTIIIVLLVLLLIGVIVIIVLSAKKKKGTTWDRPAK